MKSHYTHLTRIVVLVCLIAAISLAAPTLGRMAGLNLFATQSFKAAQNNSLLSQPVAPTTANASSWQSWLKRAAAGLSSVFSPTATINNNETITMSSPNGSTVIVGSYIVYDVIAMNGPFAGGPVDDNASVTLNIPAGTLFKSLTVGGSDPFINCTALAIDTPGPASITCTQPGVNQRFSANDNGTFSLVVQLNTASPISNSASYQDADTPAITSNTVSHTAGVAAGPPADLQITKTATTTVAGNVTAGGGVTNGQIAYTLTVTNNGPNPAIGVQVTDVLPLSLPGFSLVSGPTWTGATCSTLGNLIQCQPTSANATLAAGASGIITYTIEVAPGVSNGTQINNTALVTTNSAVGGGTATPDSNSSNNVANATTSVVTDANLSLTKDDGLGGGPVTAGGTLTYTIAVTNNGPSDAQNVVMTDTLPSNVTFVSYTTSGQLFQCTTPTAGSTGTITCNTATLPNGTVGFIRIEVRVDPNDTSLAPITNQVFAQTTTSPSTQNASITTPVVRSSILGITKTASTSSVIAGNTFTYNLNVTNGGPSTAFGASVTDILPAGLTFVSASGTGLFASGNGGCSFNAGTVTCVPNNAALPPGANETIIITVRANADVAATTGFIGPNTATVSATDPAVSAVSSPTPNIAVTNSNDLSITKEDSPDAVTAGGLITYTVNVTNNGPSDAPASSVTVTDPTPANTSLSGTVTVTGTASASFLGCAAFPCTNTNGSIPVGATATFTYQVQVASSFTNGNITNTSNVTGLNDPNPNNNQAVKITPVGTNADLQLSKTAVTTTAGQVLAGGTSAALPAAGGTGDITFTLDIRNNGPSDAQSVVVTDFLPTNTVMVGTPIWAPAVVNGQTGACDPVTNNKLVCRPTTTGAMGSSTRATITYRVQVLASVPAGTLITNQANITSLQEGAGPNATPDPNSSNNTQGPTQTLVVTSANMVMNKERVNPAALPGTLPLPVLTPVANPPVFAGELIAYQLRAVNQAGPSDAADLVITDQIPANTTFVAAYAAPNLTCSTPSVGGTGMVSCTRSAPLPPGQNASVVVVVRVNSSLANGSTISNTGIVRSSTPDPSNGNRDATLTTTTATSADLQLVAKVDAPDPVSAGSNLTYTITVRNNGPSDSLDVRVDDTLPANTTFVSANGTGVFAGRCNATMQCGGEGTTLVAGATETITLVVRVNSNFSPIPGTINNNASIQSLAGATPDPIPANNTLAAPITTTVNAAYDLSIVKEDAPDAVAPGGTLTYTLRVTNNGPSDALANAVTVSETLPGNASFVAGSINLVGAADFTCAGGVFPCVNTAGALASGETATITFQMIVNSNATGTVQNTAAVAAANDTNTGNNSATRVTPISGSTADLMLTKTASAGGDNQVTAGSTTDGQITYTLLVRNTGPSDATGVTVTDFLPANTTLVAGPTDDDNGGAFGVTQDFDCAVVAGKLTCNPVAGNQALGVSAGRRIQYTVAVNANVAPGTIITNLANITSLGGGALPNATADPNTSNNTQGPTQTVVLADADLFIGKADNVPGAGPDPVVAGDNVTYRLNARNDGPSDAQNVTVTDVLNANTTFVSLNAGTSGFTCTTPVAGATGTVSCTRATLPAGSGNQFVFVTVKVNPGFTGASISNTATINSSTPDSGLPATNTQTATTAVTVAADVAMLSKVAAPNPVVAGQNLTYTLTFANNGSSNAAGVTITDATPADSTFVSINAPVGYSCTTPTVGAAGAISCMPPSGVLAAGSSAVITFTVKVNANAGATITNALAEIATSSNENGATGNNSITNTVTPVIRQADIAVSKIGPAVVTAGQAFSYIITISNAGPSEASIGSLTLNDTITPLAALTGVTFSGTGAFSACAAAGCTNNAVLPAGGTATVTINATGAANLAPNTTINNTASVVVGGGLTDPQLGNNASTTSTTGTNSADLQITKAANRNTVIAGSTLIGDEISYTINYRNSGPGDANGVEITDIIPANMNFLNASLVLTPNTPAATVNCTYSNTTRLLSCTPTAGGVLAANTSGTIEYKVRVRADVPEGTLIANEAQIASTGASATPDPNPANNRHVPTSTRVIVQSDLTIEKIAPGTARAGDTIIYTLNATNNGPSDAPNVIISDDLPPEVTFVSLNAAPTLSCTAPAAGATGQISCTRSTLPVGATATVDITVRIRPSFTGGSIANTAQVRAPGTPDPGPNPNNATATTTLLRQSNVLVTKAVTGQPAAAPATPPSVGAGELVAYTVAVSNIGEHAISDAVLGANGLFDTLPTDVQFVSLAGTGILGGNACSFDPGTGPSGTVRCLPNGIVPVGSTAPANFATITVRVKPGAAIGALSNTATANVTTTQFGPTGQTPSGVAAITVVRKADLTVSKTSTPEAVQAGQNVTYTIKVTNNGPSDIVSANAIVAGQTTGMNIIDVLPTGFDATTITFDTSAAAGFTCTNTGLTVECANLGASFPAGAMRIVKVTARVLSSFSGTSLANTVDVATAPATDDPNTQNNRAVTTTAIGPNADLELTKTASAGPVIAGTGTITYTLNVRNNGPSDATGVRVTDQLPANTTVTVAPAGAGFTCTGGTVGTTGGATFTCTPTTNPWPINSTATITYTVSVGASVPAGTLITNAAQIATYGANATPDPNSANNTQGATQTLVSAQADVAINKTAAPASVAPGNNITYTLTVTNTAGPSDAQNIVVTDPLPAGTTFVSVSAPAAYSCTSPAVGTNGSVTCTRPTLAVGGSDAITIVAKVDANFAGATITNTGTVATTTNEGANAGANSSTAAPTTITPSAAVTIRKQITGVSNQPPNLPNFAAGGLVSYTLSVANSGPSNATLTAAGIVDTLPADVSFVSFSGTGILGGTACSFNPAPGPMGRLTCLPSGVIPAGTTHADNQVTLVVRVKPGTVPATLTNAATANVATTNTGGQTQTATASLNVVRRADLTVKKTAPDFGRAGDQIAYMIEVTNNGPSDMPATVGGITVTDNLPAQVTFVSASATGAGAFTATGTSTVVFSNGSDFPVGAKATLTIIVRVNTGVAENVAISNNARVAETLADTLDPITENNVSTATTTTTTGADIQLRKVADKTTVLAGGGAPNGQITYTIRVRNNGPSNANVVRVEDYLPANTTLVGAFNVTGFNFQPAPGQATPVAPTGTCAIEPPASGRIVCTSNNAGSDLLAGQGLEINYTVQVAAGVPVGTVITNRARAASFGANATPDPNTGNNEFGTQTTVSVGADLGVVKTANPANGSNVIAGQLVTYTLNVTNAGPSNAQNVTLTDTLSPNLKFISINTSGAPGFTCSTPAVGGTGSITCTNANLAVTGAPLPIVIVAMVDAAATGGNAVNDAAITASTPDVGVAPNNASSTTHPIGTQSTIAKLKAAQPDPVVAGENLTYTLTIINDGLSVAQGVSLTDVLPAGTTYVSHSGTGVFTAAGACTIAGSTFTCTPNFGSASAGTLAVNAMGTVNVVVKVDANLAGTTVGPNQFSVVSTTPGAAGDSNAVTVNVNRRHDLTITKEASPSAVLPGQEIAYTLRVTNNGVSGAPIGDVDVTDTIPTGTTLVAGSVNLAGAPDFTQVNPSLLFRNTAGILTVGETAIIRFRVRVDSNYTATFVNNTATVASNANNDPNSVNNTATSATAVTPSADLAVTKAAFTIGGAVANAQVTAGGTLSGAFPPPLNAVTGTGEILYVLSYRNNGPGDAANVHIRDVIPANSQYVVELPSIVHNGGGSAPVCQVIPFAGTYQLDCRPGGAAGAGLMPNGANGTITFRVRVLANIPDSTVISNQASNNSEGAGATPATPDPNGGNNASNVTQNRVRAAADLAITKTGPGGATAGSTVTYSVTVTNNGPSDAANAVMRDVLPAQVRFTSISLTPAVSGWTCTTPSVGQTGTINCTNANFIANDTNIVPARTGSNTATFTIVGQVDPATPNGTVVTNTATIAAATTEPLVAPAPNTATVNTTIAPTSNVTVTKLLTGLPAQPANNPPDVAAGELVSYTISLANDGASNGVLTAAGLVDVLPSTVSFISMSGTGRLGGNACTYNSSTTTITCLPGGTVPAGTTGNSNSLTVVVRVKPDTAPGNLANTATVNVSTPNTAGQAPTSTATVTVIRQADLTVTKKAPSFVKAGDQMSYTLTVKNNGPSIAPAGSVTVTDDLPTGLTHLSNAVSGTGAFTFTGAGVDPVIFTSGADIPVGGVATLTITTRINSDVVLNTALDNSAVIAVAGPTVDPVTDNNTGRAISTVTTGADLELDKTANVNSVQAGGGAATGRITYTINLANRGPSTANGVVMTDDLPGLTTLVGSVTFAGTSFAPGNGSATPAAPTGSCAVNASGKITCTVTSNSGALLIGQGATITYTVEVPANVAIGTIISNRANVASTGVNATSDPNTANNTDVTNTPVATGADLSIVKTATPASGNPVIAGQFIDYVLTVTNDGPSDATNVSVIDTLGANLKFVSIDTSSAPGFSCSTPSVGGTGSITCTRTTLPATSVGSEPVIRIRAMVDAAATSGNAVNNASISSSTSDPINANTSSTTHPINTQSTVAKVKSAQPNPVIAGQNVTYTLTITNNGASDAQAVSLTDVLPTGLSFVSYTGTGVFAPSGSCSFSTGTLTCTPNFGATNAGVLPVGATGTVTLIAKVNADIALTTAASSVSNAFNVTSSTPGVAGSSNAAVVNVERQSDLATEKTAAGTVSAGNVFDYVVTVRNGGPSAASPGVTVTDVLPAEVTFVSISQTQAVSFGACTTPAVGATGTVSCVSNVLMPVGAVERFIIKVRANTNLAPNTNVNNCASVATGTPPAGQVPTTDVVGGNNQACAATVVASGADLQLTKTATPASVIAGDPASVITYTINYRNAGPSDAQAVVISDVIPANLLAVGTITATGLSCNGASAAPGVQFTCTPNANAFGTHAAGVLPAGASGTISFQVRVPASTPQGALVSNAALIASTGPNATPDPNTSNNSQSTSTLVNASANLGITKTVAPNPVLAGNNVTYTVVVTNAGPSDAQNVTMTDALPAQTIYQSVSSTDLGFACTNTNNTVTCTKATLAAGASATFTIVAKVKSDTPNGTTLSNTATVGSTTADPNTANNTTSPATTTVNTEAIIAITKSDNPDPVVAGTDLTYTVTVTNNGPSDAQSFVVTDPLASELVFKSATGTGIFAAAGACSAAGNTVTCNATPGGSFPAGATANITIISKVKSSVPSNTLITNTATANWSDGTSFRSGIASKLVANTIAATITTLVIHESDMTITKEAPSQVIAGQRMDYSLTIRNNGPSDVNGDTTPGSITVMDTLPAGVMPIDLTAAPNFITSGPGGFTCSYDMPTNKVTCVNAANAAGDFPVNSLAQIIFKVKTDPSLGEGTNLNNCAMVTLRGAPDPTPEIDPTSGNNNACAATTVRTAADLGISKTSMPVVDPDGAGALPPVALPPVNAPAGSVAAGGYLRYDVAFGNAGPSDAVNVRILDIVPANTAFVGALVPTPAGAFTSATTFTLTASDTDGIAPLRPTINLTCTVTNSAGTQQISCIPAGNALPPGVGDPTFANGVLPAGYTGTLVFFAKVNESVSGGTIVANPANISSGYCPPPTPVVCVSTSDPNPGNNTSLATSNVAVASSQLAITKTILSSIPAASPAGAVVPGTFLTYRLVVTNNGPSDVANVRVTDILPASLQAGLNRVTGVKYESAVQSAGFGTTFTCQQPQGISQNQNPNGNGGTLQCTAPLMAANAPNNTATIDVTVFIDPSTKVDLNNQARIDATISNFNTPVFATTSLITPVGPTSDLKLTKTHTPDPVVAGNNLVYTVTLTNDGPSTALMASLVDTLPAYQALQNIEIIQTPGATGAPNFTCTQAADAATDPRATTSSITCTAAELPPNKLANGNPNAAGTVTFKFTVKQSSLTPQPTPTTYTNCVTATSMSFDPALANSTNVCDTVNVIFNADTAAAKVATPDPVIAGQTLTYTITAGNSGTSAALNFMITDPLPAGTVFLSATATGATLATPAVETNGTVKATWPGLTPVGTTRTLTITVRVCADYQQAFLPGGKTMCQPNLVNTASSSSDTPDAVLTNNVATANTTVQAQADLSLTKTAPAQIAFSTSTNTSVITYTLNFANAGPSNAAGTTITDVLPKGFTVQGTPTSTIPGTTFTVTTTAGVTTVVANLGTLGAANQCATTPRPVAGTVTIRAIVPIKHPVVNVTNTATIATTNCLADPNLANNTSSATTAITDPGAIGQSFPAMSEISDDKAGSVLFYPFYISDAANSNAQNTRISITNISGTEQACVHLFAVDGSTCSVLDAFICLTPNQTAAVLMSDLDPGASGYLVAVAVDCVTGLPTSFNCLIGDESFKMSNGYAANVGAETISALMPFPAGTDATLTTAVLKFDGMSYNRLPRQLAVSSIPGPNDNNSTLFILNRVGGNFVTAADPIGFIAGQVFDDAEQALSFTANLPSCQYRAVLSNTFPRTLNPFNRFIASGRTGWMKFAAAEDRALLGLTVNLNSATRSSVGGFSQGHSMHKLSLTDSGRITVPLYLPTCQ